MTMPFKQDENLGYLDSSLPVEQRIHDLISRMTLEEKVAQMLCVMLEKPKMLVDSQGNFDPDKVRASFPNGLRQVGRLSDTAGGRNPRQQAELSNQIQKWFIENSRLSIPVVMHEECLHGHDGVDATSFSQPIGLVATFDTDLVRRLYEMTAEETRVRGVHQALTPVVDVAREPRWGRVEETFGEINPGGKLPITIPRSAGHLPAYYNYKPSARRHYLFDEISPLFAFGYGLSYTHFEFGPLRLGKDVIQSTESTVVSVDVTNSGQVAGDEVVQMYIRDCYSLVTRPVKELKGFQQITIQPGETKTVTLEISPEHLAFYNIDMEYVVEPGTFEVMVGNSSQDCDLQKVTLTVQD